MTLTVRVAFLLLKTSPNAHKLPFVHIVATRRGRVLTLASSVVAACIVVVIATYYPFCRYMYAAGVVDLVWSLFQ
jgi:hypothetical protein